MMFCDIINKSKIMGLITLKNKFKYIFIIIVFLILVLAIFKTFNKQENNIENSELKYEKTKMITSLRLGIAKYDSINPIITTNREIINISPLIYEPLFRFDKNFEIVDCLAEECSKINNLNYVIKLKENIKWQDGNKFDSNDVIYTVNQIKRLPKSIYYPNVENIDTVEIVDNTTLKIKLNKENENFKFDLIFPILCSRQAENNSIQTGTGMYKVIKDDKNIVQLEKNLEYRDIQNKNARIEKINIYKFESIGEIYNSFRIGNIDFLNTSNTDIKEYIGTMGSNLKEYKGRQCDFLSLNCDNELLKNVEIRKVLNLVIDKNLIVSKELNSNYFPSEYILDYSGYLYEDINKNNSNNQKEAKEILERAGWKQEYGKWQKDGKIIKLELTVSNENNERLQVSNLIKKQLEDFGIELNINEVSQKQYMTLLENKDYEIILTGIYNSYSPNVDTLYGDNNLANYKNNSVEELIENIKNITDNIELRKKYVELQNITTEECPYIFLYRSKNITAYSSNLIGEINPNSYTTYHNIETWYRQ